MNSQLPSSFASAAAGQSNRDPRGSREGRGNGSGEWARRDGRPSNGTMTFRRSSTTPFNNQSTAQSTPATDGAAVQAPPSAADAAPYDGPLRYTREQLLEISRNSESAINVEELFVSGWVPAPVNGTSVRNWGKPNETHVPQDPSVCWDTNGAVKPVGLQEMSQEEKELFASDVNSPVKPPQQNKDGTHQGGGLNGRKPSVSHGSNFVTTPSTASRPGTRRQQTENSPYPADGLVSPTGNGRFARTDSSWFGRRNQEEKDDTYDEPSDDTTGNNREPQSARAAGFGGLSRTTSGAASAGNSFAAASALWGQSAGPASASSPMGSFGNFSMPGTSAVGDKRFASSGGSRLAHLIPKDSNNPAGEGSPRETAADGKDSWRPRPRIDTDPFGEQAGNLNALREGTSPSPKQHASQRTFETPIKGSAGDYGMSNLNLGGHKDEGTPETNPYRSPPAERGDDEGSTGDYGAGHGHGQPTEQPSGFSAIARGFPAANVEGSDRSQTSSVGANRGGFPTLNQLSTWPSNLTSGTPDRERAGFANPFGSSLFSPDVQSPGLGGLANVFGPASAGGSLRGSKLGSLFPAAMQAQMQQPEHDSLADSVPDYRQVNPLGAIGRSATGPNPRETDSPMRAGRSGMFEELFPTSDAARSQGLFTTAEPTSGLTATAAQSFGGMSGGHPFSLHTPVDGPQSQAQARQMVMPDRMRWVYMDPQGNHQGPFTGLEMNDWYKANFFTPDLRVKRVEDSDFEPLGQLIRRIGNSREPFLVPQIGVAHGPPSQTGPFSTGDSRGVIPPLVGAFPSFGRTLTAEEQNNLERRKQEEQFLMHRQREFMAQQQHSQVFNKMGMQPGAAGVLQHHSSAHSLQSQPSFGSISSPIGMPTQQPIGNMGAAAITPSYFEPTSQGIMQPGLTSVPGDMFPQDLNMQERQMLANLQGGPNILSTLLGGQRPAGGVTSAGLVAPPGENNHRSQLPAVDQLQQDPFSARLKEFQELRAQRDAEEAAAGEQNTSENANDDAQARVATQEDAAQIIEDVAKSQESSKNPEAQASSLSLTQQVQKTQAAAAKQTQPAENDALMPFPPPAGATIAAPTAQRTRSTLPDQFAGMNRSQSGTPESLSATQAAPPSLAPWASATADQKAPTFKEIQEAEAKKAARAELAAAAARRAALEQEAAALREREKTAVTGAAPILPTTSTWGSGSPVTPSGASPWAKPSVGGGVKGTTPTPAETPNTVNGKKKTLAEIQREEEVRKARLARAQEQAAAASAAATINNSMGKRYADLASKVNQGPAPAAVSAPPGWATVGAGGKVKIPTGPAAQQVRTISTGAIKPAVSAAPPSKPATVSARASPATVNKMDSTGAAMEEFNKWLRRELGRGITGGIDIDTFASTLLVLPLDQTLISDAVYANSTTMDGRHFAEEFVRRKKLADKGVVEKQTAGVSRGSGLGGAASGSGADKGWSEVAKKGGNSNGGASATGAGASPGADSGIQGAGFKVVPGRKRGKK
ncbi:hypothetical protein MCOR29_006923 [Pyricularia oryzae]|nr:hypothetical protein MCOR01_003676 [Pyricularia oryzae]KAI6315669.1 hypothetical protein MCOR29_006923 [Pyricularia oryzae]KAI6316724.1 hypothetical protein MCOR34_004222 [Pyricularia oryzae]KAI6338411.1 hypothetical protein MCOR30_003078 [Pyricularia oryzae]KAI6368236.1 hypothetical protein MCOR32_006975 [Pyricularia oryzae]